MDLMDIKELKTTTLMGEFSSAFELNNNLNNRGKYLVADSLLSRGSS